VPLAGHGRVSQWGPTIYGCGVSGDDHCHPRSLGIFGGLNASLQELGPGGRTIFAWPLNRAGARVSACHAPLLRSWQALLSTEAYLAQETTPPRQRDQHVLSDQHGLSALLASDEFANLLMRRLLHASEILQHHGAEVSRPKQRWEYRSAEACLRSFILWGRSNQPHPSWIGSREITMSGGIWSFLHMFILLGSTESDYTTRRRGWISTLCLVGWVPS
jgi:hypothetical protein